jgi:hypothetical protein
VRVGKIVLDTEKDIGINLSVCSILSCTCKRIHSTTLSREPKSGGGDGRVVLGENEIGMFKCVLASQTRPEHHPQGGAQARWVMGG